jgi:hypothetical protein
MKPPQILRAIPGRVQVHLPAWSGERPRELETRLRHVDGVREVHASGSTTRQMGAIRS